MSAALSRELVVFNLEIDSSLRGCDPASGSLKPSFSTHSARFCLLSGGAAKVRLYARRKDASADDANSRSKTAKVLNPACPA
jgi:hypothetical protein